MGRPAFGVMRFVAVALCIASGFSAGVVYERSTHEVVPVPVPEEDRNMGVPAEYSYNSWPDTAIMPDNYFRNNEAFDKARAALADSRVLIHALRAMAHRQAMASSLGEPLSSASPEYFNFMRDRQFTSVFRTVLLATLTDRRAAALNAVPVMSHLRSRRYYGMVDPLMFMCECNENAKPLALDYLEAMFPEVVVGKEGILRAADPRKPRTFEFWQEWWKENGYLYMQAGDSQDMVIDALKTLVSAYEARFLLESSELRALASVQDSAHLASSILELVDEGKGCEASSLLSVLWADGDAYVSGKMDDRLLEALVSPDAPENCAVLARMNYQWCVRGFNVEVIPQQLLALVRHATSGDVRRAAGRLLVSQARRCTPSANTVQRVVEFWRAEQEDEVVAKTCAEAMSVMFPALKPPEGNRRALEYWDSVAQKSIPHLTVPGGLQIRIGPREAKEN